MGLYGVTTKSYQFQKAAALNARLEMISKTTPPSIQPK
jgi:hypothetical protein